MKKNIYFQALLLLFLVLGLFVVVHFPYTTGFSGWDAVSPELNYVENLSRGFNSSWQENYGLGTMIGHGTGTTLLHTISVFILDIFVPTKNVRATFHFIHFLLGGIGAYALIFYIIHLVFNKKISIHFHSLSAVAGALYYVFNLGTLQLLFLPLEAFDVHFAILPWVFWALIIFIHEKKSSQLVLFFLLNILLSMQGFIPSLFVAYMSALVLFLIGFVLQSGRKAQAIQTAGLLVLVVIFANSYWLPSFTYFTIFKNADFLDAYNNQESTTSFIEQSQRFGTIFNVGILKSFYLETNIGGEQIFDSWYNYLQNPFILWLYFSFFILALFASIVSTIKKQLRSVLLPFILVFGFFFLGLTTSTFPFSIFSKTLSHFSLYEHAFRTTFTKLGTGLALSISIFFPVALAWLYTVLGKKYKVLLSICTVLLVAGISIPQFIFSPYYKKLTVTIPDAYTEITDILNTAPRSHVAMLPANCPEGWYSFNWGYVGSGFLWYQSKQPIIERFADIWSSKNEQYFWELSTALNSDNPDSLLNVFSKYNVRWIVVDENLEHCQSTEAFTHQLEKITKFLGNDKTPLIHRTESGVEKPVSLYEIPANAAYDYISVSPVTLANTQQKWASIDSIYTTYGNYILSDSKPEYFVFPTLFSLRSTPVPPETIANQDDKLIFSSLVPSTTNQTISVDFSQDPIPFTLNLEETTEGEYQAVMFLNFPDVIINGSRFSKDINVRLGSILPTSDTQVAWFSNGEPLSNGKGMLDPQIATTLELRSNNSQPIFVWKQTESTEFSNLVLIENYPISDGENQIQLEVHKDSENLQASSITNVNTLKPYFCDQQISTKPDVPKYEISTSPPLIRMLPSTSHLCMQTQQNALATNSGFIVEIASRISDKHQTRFKLSSTDGSQVMDIELPQSSSITTNYYIVPKTHLTASYTTTITSKSRWSKQPITDIASINYWQIPLHTLSTLSSVSQPTKIDNSVAISSVKRVSNTLYLVSYSAENSGYVHFYQAFDTNWIALSIPKLNVLSHKVLNRWANSWEIPNGSGYLLIIYVPQLFSYLGYILFLLGCTLVIAYTIREKGRTQNKKTNAKWLYRLPKKVLSGIYKRKK